MEAEPQREAKTADDTTEEPDVTDTTEGSQGEIDLKHSDADVARRPETFKDDELLSLSSSKSDVSVSRTQPSPNAVSNTTSVSADGTGNSSTENKLTRDHNEVSIESSYPDDSLDRTLRAATAEPVETSASLSQSQQSDRSTARTLSSSVADIARSVQKREVLTGSIAMKSSTSVEDSQLDRRIVEAMEEEDSRKRKETHSSVAVESTFVKKSTYARSHSMDTQPREGVGFAEHHLASFYSSQTAAAAAELSSGFTDNEISNDAIYEIHSDLAPKKIKLPSPKRERKTENTKPSGVTAVNASDSQDVEIKEQSLEDLAHHQNWGHQFSDDDDDVDYDIENPGIFKSIPRDFQPSPFGIHPHFRSIDVFQSKDVVNSPSASASLHSSLVDRVNRMEQVLDDIKKMALESQRTLQSRLDRLEGMVEELLQMVTTQKADTPTTPSGSAPSSLQGDVHNGASGGEHSSDMEQHSERTDSSPEPKKTRSTSHKGERPDRKLAFDEEPPSYRQHGKAEKTRRVEFLSPEEALPPLRTMESFKGDASVRPKQRPSSSRHHEDVDKGGKGTKGVHTETVKGKKGVPAETRDTYGDTRRQEAGTAGQDGGIRVYAGGLRQDSGGRGGTKTEEADLEEDDLEVRTHPKKPPRKEFSRSQRPQSPPRVGEAEEDSTTKSKPVAFSPLTLLMMKNLSIIFSRSELTTDPVAIRLATALQRAIHPGIKPMPPRAMGQCTLLVLDNSESMKGKPLQQVLKFASDFIDDIEDIAEKHSREENVALITMGGGAKVIHHLTNDYNSLRGALEGVRAEGRSPLFEATLVSFGVAFTQDTMVYVANSLAVRPRVIFITDGKITDKSQPHGPDTPSTDPKVKQELVRLLISMQSAPIYPRPIIWVPAGDADRVFLNAMANITGHLVAETEHVDYLAMNFRLQTITGKILSCMLDMPEPPVDLMESIRSHIEIFQPDLSEEYKKVVVNRVFRNLTQRMTSSLLRRFGLDERTRGQRPDRQTPGRTAPKEGHPGPFTIRGQRKVARDQ